MIFYGKAKITGLGLIFIGQSLIKSLMNYRKAPKNPT
jgi:hypothetical protein